MVNFGFNSLHYNYWEIYECIKKYYPLGFKTDHPLFNDYQGTKELIDLQLTNIHNAENFRTNWKEKCERISSELSEQVEGSTLGQDPGYSAYIELEHNHKDEILYSEQLHFSVSLLGPFIEAYILKKVGMKVKSEGPFPKIVDYGTIIVTSPSGPFTTLFQELINILKSGLFGKRKLIPFRIGDYTIKGLYARYLDNDPCTIRNALFNGKIMGPSSSRIMGDKMFGSGDWRMIET